MASELCIRRIRLPPNASYPQSPGDDGDAADDVGIRIRKPSWQQQQRQQWIQSHQRAAERAFDAYGADAQFFCDCVVANGR